MRIISGYHKGRRIIAPKKLPARPTTDRAKEALFNIISNQYDFKLIDVLDLFSGTGNISYEFCSRGVNNIHSVDKNKNCIKFIANTSVKLNMPIQIKCIDVFKYLINSSDKYDIIFADPPYNIGESELKKLVNLIINSGLIKKGGVCIVEHSKHESLSKMKNFIELRTYGSSSFSFFKEKKADL